MVDPQRTEGEPLNFLDPEEQHLLGERPLGHHDAELLHPPLDRQRARVPCRQPGRPAPRCRPGRRRHRHRRRRSGQPLLRRPRVARQPRHLGLERRRQHVAEEPAGRAERRRRPAVVRDRQRPDDHGRGQHRLPRLPRDRGRHVHLLEPRLDRHDRPGRRSRLAERIGEGAAPAGRRRDLRPASLRPEVPQPLLRLQRGQPRAHDDRPRGARAAHGDPVPQRRRSRSRRAAAGPATSSPRRRSTAGATSTPPGSTPTTAASTTRPRPTRARAGRRRFASAPRRPRPRSSSGPRPGQPGTLALAWYATDTAGQPDSFPSWANDPQGATAIKWWGYAATVANAASLSPTIAQQRFTEKPMHYGQICNQGIGCTTSGGDRTMADYFALNLDKSGSIRIVYNDTTSQNHGAHLYEVRQLDGKTLTGKRANDRVPKSPMNDDRRRRAVAALLARRRGPEPAAARPDERRAEQGEPEHAAGEDDGRQPGRDAPAAGQGERGLADALPGALGRRLRRGGLPDLLRRSRVDRRPGAAVLRRLDDLHGHDARRPARSWTTRARWSRTAASAGTRSR